MPTITKPERTPRKTLMGMPSIPHVDEMDPHEAKAVLDALLLGDRWDAPATEKVDGQNVSLGRDHNGRLFVKTKRGEPIHDPERIRHIPYLAGFSSLLADLKRKLPPAGAAPWQAFGELLPYAHTNAIAYDPRSAEGWNGAKSALILFGFAREDGRLADDGLELSRRVAMLRRTLGPSGWWVSMSRLLHVPPFYRTGYAEMKPLMSELSSALGSPEPEMARGIVREITSRIVRRLREVDSAYGGDRIEGVVVHLQPHVGGQWAKIVDRESFSEERDEAHAESGEIKRLNRSTRRRIAREVFGDPDVLRDRDKAFQKAIAYAADRSAAGLGAPSHPLEGVVEDVLDERPDLDFLDMRSAMGAIADDYLAEINRIESAWDPSGVGEIPSRVTRHKIDQARIWMREATMGGLAPMVAFVIGPSLEEQIGEEVRATYKPR